METIPTHKKIPPSKNSERRDFAFSKPRQPRFYLVFFITGLHIQIFIFYLFIDKAAAP